LAKKPNEKHPKVTQLLERRHKDLAFSVVNLSYDYDDASPDKSVNTNELERTARVVFKAVRAQFAL